MTGHCKDCRYWVQGGPNSGAEWNECDRVDYFSYPGPCIGEQGAAVWADNECGTNHYVRAAFVTGSLFGCVWFEKKPSK